MTPIHPSATSIPDSDLALVLEDYENEWDSPTLNDYFTSVAYPMPQDTDPGILPNPATQEEREAALILMRHAWIAALCSKVRAGKRRLKPSHARGYILRQEYYVRAAMNSVDDLPVTSMPWNNHWPNYRPAEY